MSNSAILTNSKMPHIYLLIHPKHEVISRVYCTYDSIDKCLEAICNIYEEHLKRVTPTMPTVTYDIMQLFDFLDSFVDICCLVQQSGSKTYAPYSKDWLKDKIYEKFQKTAMQAMEKQPVEVDEQLSA
ncbi:e-r- [Drosophila busckii]|uniref:E-r n=1 Tax=Drosophila busckii TaxID=30019 RepID=A0A0M4E1S2_DROBS|nr:e-r- [Drosophila busckii]